MTDKAALQESKYRFPYHHIPWSGRAGRPVRCTTLKWGFEYACYVDHIVALVDEEQPDSILDVGCGDGGLLHRMGGRVPRAKGIDRSERSLAFASAFDRNSEYSATPVEHVREVFDVVTAVEVIEHIDESDLYGFLEAVSGRVVEGGRLIVSVPTTVKPLQSKHYRHYTVELLEQQVAKSGAPLTLLDYQYVYREPALLKWYVRLTANSRLALCVGAIEERVWEWVWQRGRIAKESDGHHLVARYEKRR